jgi:hypothetical protein
MNTLSRECAVFCQYLIGKRPTDYIIKKYQEAHKSGSIGKGTELLPFDKLLLTVARIHPLGTQTVDVYAAVFFRNSLVRKKLILLLAILESCAPSHSYLDSADPAPKFIILLNFIRRSFVSGILLLSFMIALLPLGALVSIPRHLFSVFLHYGKNIDRRLRR